MPTSTSTASTLLSLAQTDVTHPIPKPALLAALSAPPFVNLEGSFNTRDLGLLPPPSDTSNSNAVRIRPGLVYRTGSLNGLTDRGKATLRDELGVKRVFDFRSVKEHAVAPDPEVDGVEVVWVPCEEGDATVELGEFVNGVGERGYVSMYMDVLRWYGEGLMEVLRFVRDRGGEGFVVHCNAGRDRTGVAAGMLHALAGVDEESIALDFMLSRIGTEPAREQLVAFALRGSGAESADAPGFYNLISLRRECWDAFVEEMKRAYGGWEGYVTGTLGFSEEDLVTIGKNLRGE